jgi:PAS domain S-box-containing protein
MELELSDNRRLFERIIQNSPMACTMLDAEGHIVFANRKAEEIFGLSLQSIRDRTYRSSSWKITGLDGERIDPDQLPFSLIRKNHQIISDYRHYIEVPDKTKILLSIHGSPLMSQEGVFEGAVFMMGVVDNG